jgi:hypothetical protein
MDMVRSVRQHFFIHCASVSHFGAAGQNNWRSEFEKIAGWYRNGTVILISLVLERYTGVCGLVAYLPCPLGKVFAAPYPFQNATYTLNDCQLKTNDFADLAWSKARYPDFLFEYVTLNNTSSLNVCGNIVE